MAAQKRKHRPAKPDEPRVMYTITHYCTTGQHGGCDGTSLDRTCICDCHNEEEIAEKLPPHAATPRDRIDAHADEKEARNG